MLAFPKIKESLMKVNNGVNVTADESTKMQVIHAQTDQGRITFFSMRAVERMIIRRCFDVYLTYDIVIGATWRREYFTLDKNCFQISKGKTFFSSVAKVRLVARHDYSQNNCYDIIRKD